MRVVSNTSPITNLAAVRQLNLLQQLFETIPNPAIKVRSHITISHYFPPQTLSKLVLSK